MIQAPGHSLVSHPVQVIVEQGGLQPGGLNFDAKVRRESTDLEDLFIAHIGAMDAFARGLRNAVRIITDGLISGMVKVRLRLEEHPFVFPCTETITCVCVVQTGALLKFQSRPWTESG